MAGRPEKALEADGSARTDLAIRMRQVKGSVTLKEIAAKTAYTTGYLQQVFSATTAPSRPAIEACLRALEQDLSVWEPYIAAAIAGGPAVQEVAAGPDLSADNSKSIDETASAHPHEPSPASPAQVAAGEADETPSSQDRPSMPGQATTGIQGQAIPHSDPLSPAATQDQSSDAESKNSDDSPSRRSLLIGAVVVMLLLAGAIVVAAVVRSGVNSSSTTNSAAPGATSPSASVSAQTGSSHPGSDHSTSDAPVLVTFDALGATGTQVIQVYAGPGDSSEDRQVTGTYMSGMTAPVTCQVQGRTISSDASAGEPDRTYDIWLRIAAPGPSQFATLTYASIEPADLTNLPICQ